MAEARGALVAKGLLLEAPEAEGMAPIAPGAKGLPVARAVKHLLQKTKKLKKPSQIQLPSLGPYEMDTLNTLNTLDHIFFKFHADILIAEGSQEPFCT